MKTQNLRDKAATAPLLHRVLPLEHPDWERTEHTRDTIEFVREGVPESRIHDYYHEKLSWYGGDARDKLLTDPCPLSASITRLHLNKYRVSLTPKTGHLHITIRHTYTNTLLEAKRQLLEWMHEYAE